MKSRLVGREKLPIYIVGILLVLASLFAFQQEAIASITGKIAGVVKDAETGEALPGANIIIVGTTMGAAADVDGYYFMIGVPPGVYSTQARMMGYESVTQTGVEASAGHTTPLDFELKPTTIAGKGITVKAKREIVKMDVSASLISSKAEEIEAVPLVTEVGQFLNMQAGIANWEIRGGGMDQTAFMADGLFLVDNRTNAFLMSPNLSTVQELNVIKGGFNAEYGNVRSGVINIITKEPSREKYHGSANFRYSPPHYKHRGPSVFDHNSFILRPYLDTKDSVCWKGTTVWDPDTVNQYYPSSWEGWITYGVAHGMTPEEARDRFIWLHCAEGVEDLVPSGYKGHSRERKYGNLPDWNVDASFGGPVPAIGGFLGDLTFLVSYRTNWEQFGLPVTQDIDYYKEQNASLKLISHITKNMKITGELMHERVNSVASYLNGENQGGNTGLGYGIGDPGGYMWGGDAVFWSEYSYGESDFKALYYPAALAPFNVFKNMQGLTIDHALSDKTFYTLRVTHLTSENECFGYLGTDRVDGIAERDTTTVIHFGSVGESEAPYGYWTAEGPKLTTSALYYGAHCAGEVDTSTTKTINVKFDLSSQINKYNEMKTGFIYNYDDLYEHAEKNRWESTWESWQIDWEHCPHRGGAYIQDKIEFEGIIANIGLRMDYNNPNCEWPTLDKYSRYLTAYYKDTLKSDNPPVEIMETAKGHLKISPRVGISHPITENAKLYFNYGHFYSMPPSIEMYRIHWSRESSPVGGLGNPSADLPKTVAYELGADFNIGEMFLLHLAGYYKDVTEQSNWVWYTDYDWTVNYATPENNWYEDIRGFELRLEKRVGRFVDGWVNYDYRINTQGRVGRSNYYEDPVLQKTSGLHDPFQEKPLPRPRATANIRFKAPKEWGPILGDYDLSFYYEWEAGWYMTWDPIQPANPRYYMNLQWQPWRKVNLRLTKGLSFAGTNLSLFFEVNNLFDWTYLNGEGFQDDTDRDRYLKSLKLELYKDPGFEAYEGGDDKPGDLKSKDKPYIDDPNVTFLGFTNPRFFVFGIRYDF